MSILREALRTAEPATGDETAAILKSANEQGQAVIPRGGGTKLDWGNPPSRADLILSTAKLNRVIEHAWADLTVTVEAGCTIAELQSALARHGQRLAIDVLWPERATVGGILSTNDSGVLRLRYGSLRDLVIGVTLALPDGTLARSGGKVVKNVAGYDLPKLVTGALGTLGVITEATFRLHPLPRNTRTLTIPARIVANAQSLLLALAAETLAMAALQIRVHSGEQPYLDILLEGTEEGIASQEEKIRAVAQSATVSEGALDVWSARETVASGPTVTRFSVLPSHIEETITAIDRSPDTPWSAIVQATGVGWFSVDAPLEPLRAEIERNGGSLAALRQSEGRPRIETWGDPGDALPLMRTLKQRFDPNGTLNPGRFVGGI
jgi:glycolate oxidase FAD binding subunit